MCSTGIKPDMMSQNITKTQSKVLCKVLRIFVQLCDCFPNFTLGFTSSFLFCGVPDSKGASMGSDALLGFTRHTLTPLSVSRSQSARQLDCINCTGKNKPCKLKTLPYECLFFYYTATLSFWLASEKQSTTPDGLVSSF